MTAATLNGWRDAFLAAGLMAEAVMRFETGRLLPTVSQVRLRLALDAAGVKFANGDAPGVRLRKDRGDGASLMP